MKFYDKTIYKTDKNIKSVAFMIIIFFMGFILGYCSCNWEKQNVINELQRKTNEQYIEIDALRESVNIYQMERERNNEN